MCIFWKGKQEFFKKIKKWLPGQGTMPVIVVCYCFWSLFVKSLKEVPALTN